jgi:hypothetical protein
VIFVAFKAIDPVLRGQDGGFDSHTLPPVGFVFNLLRLRLCANPSVVLIAAPSIAELS